MILSIGPLSSIVIPLTLQSIPPNPDNGPSSVSERNVSSVSGFSSYGRPASQNTNNLSPQLSTLVLATFFNVKSNAFANTPPSRWVPNTLRYLILSSSRSSQKYSVSTKLPVYLALVVPVLSSFWKLIAITNPSPSNTCSNFFPLRSKLPGPVL